MDLTNATNIRVLKHTSIPYPYVALDDDRVYRDNGVLYRLINYDMSSSGIENKWYTIAVEHYNDNVADCLDPLTRCFIEIDSDAETANILIFQYSDKADEIRLLADIIKEGDEHIGELNCDISQRKCYARVKYLLGLNERKVRTAMGVLGDKTACEVLLDEKVLGNLYDLTIATHTDSSTKRLERVSEMIVRLNRI